MEAKQQYTNQPAADQAEAGQVPDQSEQGAGQSGAQQALDLSGGSPEVPKGTCSEGQPLNTDQAVHLPGKQECSNQQQESVLVNQIRASLNLDLPNNGSPNNSTESSNDEGDVEDDQESLYEEAYENGYEDGCEDGLDDYFDHNDDYSDDDSDY